MNYLKIPSYRVTFGSTATDGLIDGVITLTENAYWTAVLVFRNSPAIYPSTVDIGTTVLVEVKDNDSVSPWNSGSYATLFSGTVLYPDFNFNDASIPVSLQCVGKGYPLNMMNCLEEYGAQSRNPTLDTISSTLTDATSGIIPKWVNKYRGTANASGYSIGTSNVESLTGTVPFIQFLDKPVDKCLDDLCDLNTALNAGSNNGPHWIVDHSAELRVKRIGASQTGWTKYYGNSQSAATLTSGVDFFDGDFQPIGKQANVVIYHGLWQRPSNGDAYTNYASDTLLRAAWYYPATTTLTTDSTYYIVGGKSIKAVPNAGQVIFSYPKDRAAAWNFSVFSERQKPTLNFCIQSRNRSGINTVALYLCKDSSNFLRYDFGSEINDDFSKVELPIGPYYKMFDTPQKWSGGTGSLSDWSEINYIQIEGTPSLGAEDIYLDGLYFGGIPVTRIAREPFPSESGTLGDAGNEIRQKVITDNIGKDDTLTSGTVGTTDTGLMAQLAKAELLRLAKVTNNGKFSTPLIPDILPGQYLYIGGADWRVTKIIHNLAELQTQFEVTDDLTNSHNRPRYEDLNKKYAAIRSEYQDRQAASLKSGNVDIRSIALEEYYTI